MRPISGAFAAPAANGRSASSGGRHRVAARLVATMLLATTGLASCADASPQRTATPVANGTRFRTHQTPTQDPASADSPSAIAVRGTADALLATLTVRGRAPMTGYDRNRFGQAWLDADRNGCDTRSDQLRRYLHQVVLRPGTHGCTVSSGVLNDPYTGSIIFYVRGDTYSVDIDHVVSLGNSWASGAWSWDIHRRAAISNDPLNLLPVDASANRSKSDGDAATWLPPHKSYRCAYVARQVTVKAKYGLSVTAAEHDAIARILATCPGQPATTDPTHAPTRVDQYLTDPGPVQQSSSKPSISATRPDGAEATSQARTSAGRVFYANCDAARAAGHAPLHRGDPGYETPRLDRDGDGIACE